MQKKDPEHIGSILKQIFHNSGWENQLEAALPLLRWQDLVGPKIAKQSQPEFLKDGVLQVRVENSVWLSHLRFLEGQLIQRLSKELPSLEIKEIRFRQGPLEAEQQLPSSSRSETVDVARAEAVSDRPLSPEQLKLLEKVIDPELRRDLEALLKKRRKDPHT